MTPLPKKGFWTPLVRYVFFFLYKNLHDRAAQKLFWRGPKIFGRGRSLVRFPPPIRFAPPHITAQKYNLQFSQPANPEGPKIKKIRDFDQDAFDHDKGEKSAISGAPSPLEALLWIFLCFFSSFYVQLSKTSPLKSGESSEKSSGENRVKSCHVCGCHGFLFGSDESSEIENFERE